MRIRAGFSSVLLIATLAGTGAMPVIGAGAAFAASLPVALNVAPSFTLAPDPSVPENSGAVTIPGFATGQAGPPDEAGQALAYVLDGYTSVKLFTVPPAISPAGDLTFTLAPDLATTATVTIHLTDNGPSGGGNVNVSPEQTFHILVTPVAKAPVAVDDGPILVHKDTTSGFYNVRQNDDYDYYDAIVVDADVSHGVLDLDSSSGNFTYMPEAGYVGPDSFTYHLHAGALSSNVATVTFSVYVNHPAAAVADSFTVITTTFGSELTVLANDDAANPDQGEFLEITRASRPAHGAVSFDLTSLFYVPKAGFYGTDVFTYTISDGSSTSTATVHVKVVHDTIRPVSAVSILKVYTVTATSARILVAFCGTDIGSGVTRNELWESVNGHPSVRLFSTTACIERVTAKVGSTIRFRARATDRVGNVGLFAYGPSLSVHLYQETAATFPVPWQSVAHAVYLGGREARTTTAGADVVFTSIGRTFTWLGTMSGYPAPAPGFGRADVYVDGAWTARVTTQGSYSTVYHAVLFTCSFAVSGRHTIRIVSYDPGKRINVDGFLVLR